jgi:hypothetical protein
MSKNKLARRRWLPAVLARATVLRDGRGWTVGVLAPAIKAGLFGGLTGAGAPFT